MDFAFFAVNFGYSKRDYEELTKTEKAFIFRAYEDKVVAQSTVFRDAVLNAVANAFRKKNSKFKKLWKKVNEKVDKEVARKNMSVIMEIEEREGKQWVERVFQENGIQMKRG